MSSPPSKSKAVDQDGPTTELADETPLKEDEEMNESSPAAAAGSSTAAGDGRCAICTKRKAREGCTQTACLVCCLDGFCQVHKKAKEQRTWREKVIKGTTFPQRFAAEKRLKRIPPGRFREAGFLYQGDTIVLWDLRTFMRNPKWKEEAIRKSKRRRAAQSNVAETAMTAAAAAAASSSAGGDDTPRRRLHGRKRRFERILEDLRQKAIEKMSASAATSG